MGISDSNTANLGLPWTLRQLPAHQPSLGDSEGDESPAAQELFGKNRPWMIEAMLGTEGEAEALASPGEIGVFTGVRPIIFVYALKGLRSGSASHQAIAERVVECVNFAGSAQLPSGSLADLLEELASSERSLFKSGLEESLTPKKKRRRKTT